MELRQLLYFQTVAELEHVTKASERLMVAQSALSRQIHLLEEELGVRLFYREGTGIRLAPFGRQFLVHAARILREAESAKREAEHYVNPDSGTVRLGFPHSAGLRYVPRMLADFQEVAPRIQFDLVQSRVHDLLQSLYVGDLDLAIITPWEDVSQLPHIVGEHLYTEDMRVILPVRHAFADRTSLALPELRDEPFVLFKTGYTLRNLVWDACIDAGFAPKVAFEAEETDTVRAFVQAGLGISILPISPDDDTRDIRVVPVSGRGIHRSVGLAWHRESGQSGPAKRFAEFVIDRARGAQVTRRGV